MTAKRLILSVCKKYIDAKNSYKRLLIYCFMEQGCQFPLSIDDILNCYSTETIRRTFQELKRDGEIFVDEETQKNWDKKEHKIRSYYRGKKKLYFPQYEEYTRPDGSKGYVQI